MAGKRNNEKQREYDRKYRATHRSNISVNSKKYYNAHREEINMRAAENSRKRRKLYPEKIAEANKIWRENNREYDLERQKKWHADNYEHGLDYSRTYRLVNHDKCKESSKLYRKNNPEKVRYWTRLRRARKLSADGRGITAAQEREIFEEYGHRCVYCGRNDVPVEIDHIEPIVYGGLQDIENATVSCHSCNASKQEKTLLRFLYDRNIR